MPFIPADTSKCGVAVVIQTLAFHRFTGGLVYRFFAPAGGFGVNSVRNPIGSNPPKRRSDSLETLMISRTS